MLAAFERVSCLPPRCPSCLAGFCHRGATNLELIWAPGEEHGNTMVMGMKSNGEDDTQETHPYQGTTLYQKGAVKTGKSYL